MKIGLPALTLVLFAATASAQPPPRVRGVIQAVEGQTLVVATENEGVVRLTLTDMTGINGLEKRTMADIKDNTFVGVTAVKNRDGRWQATVTSSPSDAAPAENYAWDLPGTLAASAATSVIAADGGMTVRRTGDNVGSTRGAAIVASDG
jgi:hypothetical protein